LELGLSGNLFDDLNCGFLLANPEKQSFNESPDLVTRMVFGLQYLVSQKVNLYAELEKQLEEDFSFKTGLDYALHPLFDLRIGYNTLPGQISMGFGWTILDSFNLETAFSYNSTLGITPVLTLKYLKSQKED